jgi:hypothetical protein
MSNTEINEKPSLNNMDVIQSGNSSWIASTILDTEPGMASLRRFSETGIMGVSGNRRRNYYRF